MKSLEERIQMLEDRVAISELMASYGGFADSGNGQAIADLWTDDGTYSYDEFTMDHDQVRDLVALQTHRDFMDAGCAHVLTAPSISIDGDHAVATCHSLVFVRRQEPWVAERVSANRWTFVRTDRGWKVASRENHLLTGQQKARDLFARS